MIIDPNAYWKKQKRRMSKKAIAALEAEVAALDQEICRATIEMNDARARIERLAFKRVMLVGVRARRYAV